MPKKQKLFNDSQLRRAAGHVKESLKRQALDLIAPLRTRLQPRKINLYCVGTPKTGTTSMVGLFGDHFRVQHEPEYDLLLVKKTAQIQGRLNEDDLVEFFARRDRRLWLEVESSHPTGHFIRPLVQALPEARFMFLIRDCYSWLDSWINLQINTNFPSPRNRIWRPWTDAIFRADLYQFSPQESALSSDPRLYPLDGYLHYWSEYNRQVLACVPPERLLIVRTHEINQSLERIATFLDIPVSMLNRQNAHLRKAPRKNNLLYQIERDFLEDKVQRHCHDLMANYFPEIKSLEAALPQR